ncbi:hypothetical protein EGW08_013280 [Elysia chlorotica]|uniref:G-protein coupled receptors family 1 profile domain-containing protein n=1 Tax=Elysia chlorotica TaxID=188477 RepID=A0A3S0ZND6_ELYCH|nr:hypothetical protein EGW08_013280 [Elysia chlorotica]
MAHANLSLLGESDTYYSNHSTCSYSVAVVDCNNTRNTDVLCDNHIKYFTFVLRVCLCPLLSACSIIVGLMNIIVFSNLNLKDILNRNFLILSVGDALQGLFSLSKHICFVLNWFGFCFRDFSYSKLFTLFDVANTFALITSNTTTTVIAVVRCCCATMPFAVRKHLTATRQLAAILIPLGACMAITIYAATVNSLENLFLKGDISVVWDLSRLGLNTSFLIIIFISMIILIRAVQKSARCQQRVSDRPSNEHRSVREGRVMRGVILVLAIYTVSNVLIIPIATIRLFMPELRQPGHATDAIVYLMGLSVTLVEINTTVNFFVYYVNDLRFRRVVHKLLRRT